MPVSPGFAEGHAHYLGESIGFDQIEYEKTEVVEGAEGRPVTIRTLDVGGDKFLSYLDYPKEQNPYLG